ncbi:MAG: helix-turn-helix domain-containing protein [Lachnospiraceae bacterium]
MGVENIGENILKLRRKKGITQEALAEFIGVTKTSVSKWETGTTMPDIQILPILASYFGVSIDELIGYTPMLSREQIRFQYHRLAEEFSKKPFAEVFAECESLIKKYYSCHSFLQQMIVLLINHVSLAADEQEKNHALQLAGELCDHILADCQDVGICNNVIVLKEMLNLQCGRPETVIEELADETLNVNLVDDKGSLLTLAYLMAGKLKDAENAAQIGMYRSLMDLFGYGMHLLQAKQDDPTYGVQILSRFDQIIEAFSMLQLTPNTVAGYEYQAALFLAGNKTGAAKLWDDAELEEKIVERLEKYISAGIQLLKDDVKLHGDSFFYHLDSWFADLELGLSGVRSKSQVLESLIQGLSHPAFLNLQNHDKLNHLREELQNAYNQKSD